MNEQDGSSAAILFFIAKLYFKLKTLDSHGSIFR